MLLLVISISALLSPAGCASFQQIQAKLAERTQQGMSPDDIVITDVKKWVSDTVSQLTNQVEYIGNEIEKAVFRQTILEHNRFLSDDGVQPQDLQRESPVYDVICASPDGYETRQYREALWVITFGNPGEGYIEAKLRCESKIQIYILGENERGAKIHITSPWLSQVFLEGDHAMYAFLFYVPSKYQDDPPPPTDRTPHVSQALSHPPAVTRNTSLSGKQVLTCAFGHGDDVAIMSMGTPSSPVNLRSRLKPRPSTEVLAHCPTAKIHDEIFFTYMSPKVFAFSLDTVPIGTDGGLLSYKGASSLLHLGREHFNDRQYFLADYEAPFTKASLNNELLIPMNASLTPHCGLPEPTPDVLSVPDAEDSCSDCIGGKPADRIRTHLEVRDSSKYLRKVTNICSFDAIDMVIMDLFLYCQHVLPIDDLSSLSGDILLRVSGEPTEGDDDCNAVSIDVLLKLPRLDQRSIPLGERRENISVAALDSMLVYSANVSKDELEASDTFFEEVLPTYSKLRERLVDEDICFKEHDFYLSGNLKTYPAMTQVQIPYSNDCWQGNAMEDNGRVSSVDAEDAGSGARDEMIDLDTFF